MNMTDRELLELAAEAAFGSTSFVGDMRWNPLTDDGDALRLAVKLELEILVTASGVRVFYGNAPMSWEPDRETLEPWDKCAATRRAIVRAAAEIGKAK